MAVGLRVSPAQAQKSILSSACLVPVSQYKGAEFHFRDADIVEVAASGDSIGSCGSCCQDTVTIEDRLCDPAFQLTQVGICEAVGLGPRCDGADSSGEGRHRHMECVRETLGETKRRGQCCCEGDKDEVDNIERDLGTTAETCLVRRELPPIGLEEEAIAASCSRHLWNSDPCRSCLACEAYYPVWLSS